MHCRSYDPMPGRANMNAGTLSAKALAALYSWNRIPSKRAPETTAKIQTRNNLTLIFALSK